MADSYNTMRYLFQNIRGMRWRKGQQIENGEGFKIARSIGATVLGLAETNTEWNLDEGRPRRLVRQQARGAYGHAISEFSTSRIKHTGPYKPGGTMTTIANPWHSHVVDQGNDKRLGNWSYITLRGKRNSKLTFLTVYRVNDQGLPPTKVHNEMGAKGSITCCTQQYQILREEGKHNVNPRNLCLEEIQKLVREKFSGPDHHLVLGIDANEDMEGLGPRSLNATMSDLGLHDALRYAHQDDQRPPTIASGTKTIDHIFATAGVLPHITAAGELDYDSTFLSDHPALCIDIDATAILSDDFTNYKRHKPRKLIYSLKDRVNKYQSILIDLLECNHVPQRLANLLKVKPDHWTSVHTRRSNNLDDCITTMMLRAARKCSPGQSNSSMWSDDLHKIGSTVSYWNLVRRSLRQRSKVKPSTIERKRKFARVAIHGAKTRWAALAEYKYAKKQLDKIREKHHETRKKCLERKAAAIDEDKGRDPEKTSTLRQLIRQEYSKRSFRKCKAHLGKQYSGGLQEILIPTDPSEIPSNETTEWRKECSREGIHDALLKQNERQFYQAHYTPFASGPIAEVIGCDGTSETAESILNGTFEVQASMKEIQQLINTFRKDKETPNIDQLITPAKFRQVYGRLHEMKASSVSGRDISHYKSAMSSDFLVEIHCGMMCIPWKYGIIYIRWTKVVDACIGKENSPARAHRIRIVQLIESDLNQSLLIIFTRPITIHCMRNGIFHASQYAQQQQQCTSAVLSKVLSNEYHRISRRSMVWMEIDAKGCFDRILPILAILNLRRLGASKESCKALGTIWKNLTHRVKTGAGISDNHYPQDPTTFQAGAGQGSTIAMMCWCLLSSQILSLLENTPKLRAINAMTGKTIFEENATTYVDDTSHANSCSIEETISQDPTEITQGMCNDLKLTAQTSLNGLHATGGDWQLPKCHYATMTHEWLPDGDARLHRIEETPAALNITHGSGSPTTQITRLEPDDACKTLGCYIALDGNTKKQENILWSLATSYSAGMRCRGTSKYDAYMKYTSFTFPAMSFSLGVTDINQNSLNEIETRYTKPTKQQLGFRSTVKSAILFAPRAYLGMGLESLAISCDVQHLKMLCGHLREDGPISQQLIATISVHQLQSGMCKPILNCEQKYRTWLEPGWISYCCDALERFDIKIHHDSFTYPKLTRAHDECLMERFRNSKRFGNWYLKKLNRVRIWLKVTTISDIATGCGTRVDPSKYAKTCAPKSMEESPFHWPLQSFPDKQSWRYWRCAIRLLTISTTDLTLIQPLGRWISKPRQNLEWFIRPNKTSLIRRDNSTGIITQHIRKPQSNRAKGPQLEFRAAPRPFPPEWSLDDSYPLAEVVPVRQSSTLRLTATCSQYQEPLRPGIIEPPQTTCDIIKKLHPFYHQLFTRLEDFDDEFAHDNELRASSHTPLGASCLSKIDKRNKQLIIGWELYKMTSGHCDIIAKFNGTLSCHPEERTIRRGKQLGLIAIHVLLNALEQLGITFCGVQLEQDTYGVLDWTEYAGPKQGFNCLTKPNSDISKELLNWTRSIETGYFTCKGKIPGYIQSNRTQRVPSPILHPNIVTPSTEPVVLPPASKFHLIINNTQYAFIPVHRLKEARTLPDFRDFLKKWCDLEHTSFHNVDWNLTAQSINQVSLDRAIPIIKFTCNELATGDRMLLCFKHSPACPYCGRDENIKHLFACNAQDAIENRDKSLTSLLKRLDKLCDDSSPIWTDIICSAIQEMGGNLTRNFTPDPSLEHLRAAQRTIGWMHLLQGRVHKNITNQFEDKKSIRALPYTIKAIWKFCAIIWRLRNQKKHGHSPEERTHKRKERFDAEICSLRTTLDDHGIPYAVVPHGYKYHVDHKRSWLRGSREALLLWTKGEHPLQQPPPLSTSPLAEITASQTHSTSTTNLGNSSHPPTVRLSLD